LYMHLSLRRKTQPLFWGFFSFIYWLFFLLFTITIGGYFAIQISSQTTKKEIVESLLLRTIIPHKLLTFCDTITFAPIPSQVLHNSRTW
jgi:hypothetical protein